MNLTWSLFTFATTLKRDLKSHAEGIIWLLSFWGSFSRWAWCPAHYRLTHTNTPLFTVFVGADPLNNAGVMEVRECLHVFFCFLCEGFHSHLCVPVSKPAVLKGEKKKKKRSKEEKLGGQPGRRDGGKSSKSSLWVKKHTHYVQSWIIWHENTNLALDLQYTDSQLTNIHTLVGIFRCFLLV